MTRPLKRLGIAAMVVGLGAGLTVAGTATWAAIPDSTSGQITACYPTSGPNQGQLTVIDAQAGKQCATGQATLTWQQQAHCIGWPHPGVDWSLPGSTPGNGCNFAGLRFPDQGNAENANLTNANLTGAHFCCLDLKGAIFTGANLTDAEVGNFFTNANLRSALAVGGIYLPFHMSGWDMSNLDLNRMIASGADLTNANLSGSNLTSAILTSARVTGATFTGTNLRGASVSGSTGFTNADLRAASAVVGIHLSDYNTFVMTGWDISTLDLTNAFFKGADMAGVNATGANLTHASLNNASLTGGNLTGANLTQAVLSNANLTQAVLTNATLTGVAWSNTTCPDGTNSNSHGNTCVGHL